MLPWVVNCRHRPARATVQHRHNDLSAVLALAIHLVQFPYCTVFLPIPFSFNRFYVVQQKQGGGRGVQSMTTRSISGISSPALFTDNCGLPFSSKSNHSRTSRRFARNPNYSRTYAYPRGWGSIFLHVRADQKIRRYLK